MTAIANATGLYNTLGYNFDDPNNAIQTFSTETQTNMGSVPPLMSSGFANDIINNDINGYFRNPVSASVQSISNSDVSIKSDCVGLQGIDQQTTDLFTAIISIPLTNTCTTFIQHTDRISGLTDQTIYSTTQPNYKSATSIGKLVMYLTNQTDSITDNSPLLGAFTSLFINNQLSANANTMLSYASLITNSLANTASTTVPGEFTIRSNLTYNQVLTISSGISGINTLLNTRRIHDEHFYQNSRSLVAHYSTIKGLGMSGESDLHLINNFIGTPKLIDRVNT